MSEIFELGVNATVVMDSETYAPVMLATPDGLTGLRTLEDVEELAPVLVADINIVSIYTLHVALYALQNPTPENIRRALYSIGTSGDCEEHIDCDTLMPLAVSEPPGWNDWLPETLRAQEGDA